MLYTTPEESVTVQAVVKDESLWLTQKSMAELFGCTADNISLHLKNIYNEGELREEATSTVEWESVPMIDRPLFVFAYVKGALMREKRVEELEKENKELKDKLERLAIVENTAIKGLNYQLTEAKELLRKFLGAKSLEETFVAESEAEKFLKEVSE